MLMNKANDKLNTQMTC